MRENKKRGREEGKEEGGEGGEAHNQPDSLGLRVCAHLFISNIGILFAQQASQKENKKKKYTKPRLLGQLSLATVVENQ